ncbi:MAG: acetamidase/formamidase family protein, partial [Nitrospira sp.]|nr:acetamidase/formamidase family protein [Nitrospira sp.]
MKRKRWMIFVWVVVLALGLTNLVSAKTVKISKTGEQCSNDPNCHNRWHPDIKPVVSADPGDILIYETRDALDHAFTRNSTAADVVAANLNLVHPLTGPVFINGAERGDVLAITLIDIEPAPFGYTVIVPGFGFLRDLFPNPYIVRWDLNRLEATSPDMSGVWISFDGFMGTIGVAP